MRSDEETKKGWRRVAYGKLLVGTTLVIEGAIHSASNRYEFERPLVHTSKIMSKKELDIYNTISNEVIKAVRRLRVLGWHLQGMKPPKGYKA